jgi:hypothetical protein
MGLVLSETYTYVLWYYRWLSIQRIPFALHGSHFYIVWSVLFGVGIQNILQILGQVIGKDMRLLW